MKYLILKVIELYWKLIPAHYRRPCVFKETCSVYVHRHTTEQGFLAGITALFERQRKCRKGYQLQVGEKGFELKLSDASVINEQEISPSILSPLQNALAIEQLKWNSKN